MSEDYRSIYQAHAATRLPELDNAKQATTLGRTMLNDPSGAISLPIVFLSPKVNIVG